MTSAELVQRAIAKAGSQRELSKATGIAKNTINAWVRNGSQPTWSNAYLLLQFLGLELVPAGEAPLREVLLDLQARRIG